jgi:hypothetical protein|tara:strand:+ start:1720 stop:2010 length:291 start_codon:yes stop_codon:yes gene_type:complete
MFGQAILSIIILLFLVGSISIIISICIENKKIIPVYSAKDFEPTENIEELDKYFSKDDQEDSKPISDILDSFNLEELKVEDEIVDIHEEEVIINDQ